MFNSGPAELISSILQWYVPAEQTRLYDSDHRERNLPLKIAQAVIRSCVVRDDLVSWKPLRKFSFQFLQLPFQRLLPFQEVNV